MNPQHLSLITKQHIQDYLDKVYSCIDLNEFNIALHPRKRAENVEFKSTFQMTDKKYKELFKSLVVTDFSHTLQNEHEGFENETLYVFRKDGKFIDIDGEEHDLTLYIKINLVEDKEGYCFFISCHPNNAPIEYYF